MASHKIDPGYVIADKYRVVDHIGDGGMGQVYLVQHVMTDERFALKILNPSVARTASARERFRREARTPARIDSDHVCRVVDTDIATDLEDAPFLVMEYLRGQNLQQLSDEIGALAPREVLVYLRQIAIALDKAHAIGVVHRDLKPENLFLCTRDDGSPCIKILDFGIAKLSGATGDLACVKATQTGDVFGTPLFMSPEQCKSESEKISAQSDIWAVGLIAHRLLTGEDFWTANTLTHLIAQIAYEPIPRASERGANFGAAYDAWFERCCAREPSERFGSAGEAVKALTEALGLTAEATGQITGELVAAGVARAAMLSSPGRVSSPERERRLQQTSEALTLDTIESRIPRKSRVPIVALGLIALASGGIAAWMIGFGSPAPTPADPAVQPLASGPLASGPPAAAPEPAPQPSAVAPQPSAGPAVVVSSTPAASSTAGTPRTPGSAPAKPRPPLKGPILKPPPPPKGVDPLGTRT